MGNKTRHTANLVSDNNLFVDIANDRVGIGSTQPTAKLNVAGIVSATEYYGSGANLTGIVQDLTGKANVTISDNPPGITTAHGDLWWESDTAKGHIYYNDGSSAQWVEFNPSGGGGGGALNNIVEDPTPQLGGNLDLFGKNINGTGDINITGDVTATSFVGDGSGLTGVVGSGSGIVVQHDGSNVGTAGTINFSTNLDVTPIFAGIVTVTASGGGGISTHDVRTNSLEVYTGVSTFVGYAATYAAHFKNNIFIDAGAYAMFGNSIDKFSIRNTAGKSQLISGQNGGNVEILSQQSGSFVKIGKHTGGANDIALFTVDAGVELFHNTDKKFETTSTGANVTGILTATSIVKSGGTSSQYLMADGSVSTGSGGSGITTANINADTLNVSGISTFSIDTSSKSVQFKNTGNTARLVINMEDSHSPRIQFISSDGDTASLYGDSNANVVLAAGNTLNLRANTNETVLQGDGNTTIFAHNVAVTTVNTGGVSITGVCTATSFSGNGSGLTNLPGISNVVEDTSPQLGGNLNVNGSDIISTGNGDIDFTPNGTGAVVFKGVSSNGGNGAGRFKLNCENNSHGITIQGPPHSAAANYTLTLPNNDGSTGQFLKTDGSGVLSFATVTIDLVTDPSPQLGGNLDVQSSEITTSTNNANIKLAPNGTGVVEVRGAGGSDGTLQLNCSAQSHGIKLKSPPHSAAASYTLTFPNSIVADKFLKSDSSGNLSFSSELTDLVVKSTHSNGAVNEALRITTTGSYSGSNSENSGPAISFGQFHGNYPSWTTAQIAGIRKGTNWNGALSVYTNTGSSETDLSEKVRVTSEGSVNIGGDFNQSAYKAQITGDLLLQKSYNAYKHPQLEIYNTYNGGWGGAIKFSGYMNSTKYQQAAIKVFGGSNLTDGSLAFETGDGTEKLRIKSDGNTLIPGTQTTSSETGKLDIYHTSPDSINSPHIRLWGAANNDARIEFGSPVNTGEGGYIMYNDSSEGLFLGSRMSGFSDVNICTGMNDGSPTSNVRLCVTAAGHTCFSGLTTNIDTRNPSGISIQSSDGITFRRTSSTGSRNWRLRPDDLSAWGSLEFSVAPTDGNSDIPDSASDVVLELKSNKDVKINNGNLILTNTKGISFYNYGSGTDVSSNTLDDYEEGTFTPSIDVSGTSGSLSVSYSAQVGRYVKVGRIVHFTIDIRLSSWSRGTGTGGIMVLGLPFAPADSNNYSRASGFCNLYNWNYTSDDGDIPTWAVYQDNGHPWVNINKHRKGNTSNDVSDPGSNSMLFFSGTYEAGA